MHVTLKNYVAKYFDIGGGDGGVRSPNEGDAGVEARFKDGLKLGLKLKF
jgi:hypothetical protein